MTTTFNVISLGNLADIDTIEGNGAAENAAALVGLTIGGPGDSLASRVQTMSTGAPGRDFDSDGNVYYDQDDATPEKFRIDGGPQQNFDASVLYDATLTYFDGSTATITAVVFQDTNGNTYLAPELTDNADQAALEAAPLRSITLDALTNNTNAYLGMAGDREDWDVVPCFASGTRILTPQGERPIDDLAVGDLVVTLDRGPQPLRWIGRRTCAANASLTPVRIAQGALGQALPTRDLLVSPQHRMLVRSRIARRMTGASEVLVPVHKLLGLPGVARADDLETVTYLHLMFDRHEIVLAEGAPTESLLTGPEALKGLGPEAEAELRAIFPALEGLGALPARPIPKGHVMRRLVSRHHANGKAVLQI